ncbi:MAG: hypothetical protein Q8S21_06650 [Candidatus Paracaedibacteraceae bacterium]|nr:hypothetical protein [Candidatus Paracaedibacteraceae bacterium]
MFSFKKISIFVCLIYIGCVFAQASQDMEYTVLAVDTKYCAQNKIFSIATSLQDNNSNELDSFKIDVIFPAENCSEKRLFELELQKQLAVAESNFKEHSYELELQKQLTFEKEKPIDPDAAVILLSQFLDRVDKAYPETRILSSNFGLNINILDFFFILYRKKLYLRYKSTNENRTIFDFREPQNCAVKLNNSELFKKLNRSIVLDFRSKWDYDGNLLNDVRVMADTYNLGVKAFNLLLG